MCCVGGEKEEGPVIPSQSEDSPFGDGPASTSGGGFPPGQLTTNINPNPTTTIDGKRPAPGPTNPFLPSDEAGSSFGRKKKIRRLYCKTGYDVGIFPNGEVRGVKNPRNKFGMLEFESAGLNGEIRIKGVSTGFYITMTPKGKVMGQPQATHPGTVWVETKIGTGVTYMSLLSLDYAHRGFYLALKKSGKPKRGDKTNHPYPQKAISFLPRVVAEE